MARGGEFCGEWFPLDPDASVSEFTLMELAEAEASGDAMASMAAIMRVVTEVLSEDECRRFRLHGREQRATAEQVSEFFQAAMTDRPTERPSGSSDGSPSTSKKSGAGSSSRATARKSPKAAPASRVSAGASV